MQHKRASISGFLLRVNFQCMKFLAQFLLFLISVMIARALTRPSLCLKPVDRGNCNLRYQRYRFNPDTEKCETFQYSGCGGNRNNFPTKTGCTKVCKPKK
ncbi:Kunitz/Bovine pancreatic trypsin inhibitor domain protein [Ancylostoma ceylanicum]|uniref:Kunitz/Bovine pancreatic trypsin inhibitor domain protein n=1 Tax=Ancylostoma ceylanicum TaxID=53326 RepID=A0A0D6LDS3_9BILA|nr:Kunitz/Bovine pancreatic trypsin inhibitor domain protein [Ancylostoma ceylanicum]